MLNSISTHLIFPLICIMLASGCDSMEPPDPIPEIPKDEAPTWSPDGKYIAFQHFNPSADKNTNPYGLYILNLETGERELVIEGQALAPDWSPDGKWIAFQDGVIFKIRPDGSDLKQLTEQSMSFKPRWSPDGNTLSYGKSGEQSGLWFFHLSDSIYKRFGYGSSPADWSPDGQKIVYGASPQDEDPEKAGSQIWIADTNNTNNAQLSTNDFIVNRHPSWSPNGKWIAWHANNGIWIMRSDGSEQKHLIEGQSPSWSPDSHRIVFSKPTPDESKVALWIINKDGSGLEQITF